MRGILVPEVVIRRDATGQVTVIRDLSTEQIDAVRSSVISVAGKVGEVVLTTEDILGLGAMVDQAVDPLVTFDEMASAIAPLATAASLTAAVAPLASKTYVDNSISPLATTASLTAAIAPLAAKTYVDNATGLLQPLSEKNAANGYAGLNASGLIAPSRLGTGSTGLYAQILHGDGTWALITSSNLGDDAVDTRVLADLAITHGKVAAANKDGAVGTPSMRTLGTGAQQALPGNHPVARTDQSVTFSSVVTAATLVGTSIVQTRALNVVGPAGEVRDFAFHTGTIGSSSPRWIIRADGTAEAGTNLGSDFQIIARKDDGTPNSTPILIRRDSGLVVLDKGLLSTASSAGASAVVARAVTGQTALPLSVQDGAGTVMAGFTSGGAAALSGIRDIGFVGPMIDLNSAGVFHTARTATQTPGVFRGAASQTSDILQIRNSADTTFVRFNSSGALVSGRSANVFGSETSPGGVLGLVAPAAGDVPLIVRGAASQTNNLAVFQDSSGTAKVQVWNDGSLYTASRLVVGGSDYGAQISSTAQSNRVGIQHRAFAGQTADLLTLQGSTGTALFRVDNVGLAQQYRPGQALLLGSGLKDTLAASPLSTKQWHDHFRFSNPDVELYDGTTWTAPSATEKNNALGPLSGRSDIAYGLNSTTRQGVRYTWNPTNSAGQIQYSALFGLFLAFQYSNNSFNAGVKVEYSADGVTWTEDTANSGWTNIGQANATSYFLRTAQEPGANGHVRVTVLVTPSATPNQTTVNLISLQYLSARHGDQGGGEQHEMPFWWDQHRRVRVQPVRGGIGAAFTVQGAASDLDVLTEWKNAAGSVVASVTKNGDLNANVVDAQFLAVGLGAAYEAGVAVLVRPLAANGVGKIIRGLASQTGDLLQLQNSASAVQAKFDSGGNLFTQRGFFGVTTYPGAYSMFALAGAADQVGVAVKGQASQTADLLQFQNSAGAVASRFTSDGFLRVGGDPGGMIGIVAGSPANRPFVVRGAAAQSANLGEFQDSAAQVIVSVDGVGQVKARGYSRAITSKTADYTATNLDSVVLANGTLTVTLPSAATAGAGREYDVKNIGTGTVTVASSSGTIDGVATKMMSTQYEAMTFISDGTNWWIL